MFFTIYTWDIFVFFPKSFYSCKKLDKAYDEERIVNYCLKVEEISIATESLHPSDPEIQDILHAVYYSIAYDNKSFNMSQELVAWCQTEEYQV